MNTRERLSLFAPKNIHHFSPQAVLDGEANIEAHHLQARFFSALTDIVSRHSGQKMLAVRRRYVDYRGQRLSRTHLYLGLIDTKVEGILSPSGEVAFPTSRYVDSPKSLYPINRTEGRIPGNILGKNIVWKFFSQFDNGHALDFFIGREETDQWFSQRAGTCPYIRPYLSEALGYPMQVGENLPIRFA